ncbi:MAG: energy transducer TonB [Cytophagales bacterium]|nr:energy transducer TonB [Cytophagales bacterium]
MEQKKNPEYDLNTKRGMFFNLGLTVSLFVTILAFEWPNKGNQNIIDLGGIDDDFEDILQIPPTSQPPPPPPVAKIPEIVEVPDEEEIKEDVEVELDVEVTEETVVEDIIFAEVPKDEVSDEIFIIVEERPEFPGGEDAFRTFLYKNLKYPYQAKKMGIEGRVYVQFVVERDGSITDLTVVKGLGAGCDVETLRVMKLVPNFSPGKQRGSPVRVKMVLPIFFRMS